MWRVTARMIIRPTNNGLSHIKYVVNFFNPDQAEIKIVKGREWVITENVDNARVESLLKTARQNGWIIEKKAD